jgi:biopolymer transport protein ExbD
MKQISPDQWINRAYYLTGILLLCLITFVVAVTVPTVAIGSADVPTVESVAAQDEPSENITITVTDSTGETATEKVPIKIATDNLARFDTDDEEGIDQGEALAAISAYNDDGLIGGEEVTQTNALKVISAYNSPS